MSRGHAWQGMFIAAGMCGREGMVAGETATERALHILLECILVV